MENLKPGTPVRIKSTHHVAEMQRKVAYIVDPFKSIVDADGHFDLYWVETKESRDAGKNLLRLVPVDSFFVLRVTDAPPCPPCAEGYCQDCMVAMGDWDVPDACGCETCAGDRAELETETVEFFNGLSDFFTSIDPENWVGWYVEEPLFDVVDLNGFEVTRG